MVFLTLAGGGSTSFIDFVGASAVFVVVVVKDAGVVGVAPGVPVAGLFNADGELSTESS